MSDGVGKLWYEIERGRFRVEHPLVVNVKDGSVLVYVPAGKFEMGDGQGSNCPKHRVELSAYWIGVYAVTNGQYLKFVQETGHRVPDHTDYGEAVWKGRSFPPAKGDHPVVCVSWEDSVAYAKWAECELASEAQWEKACRGPLGMIYPWGQEWDASRCRNNGNKGNEQTCAVNGYPSGASGYGTYNQSGNVWEWCADWFGEKYYGASPARDPGGPEGGSRRVARGGSWGDVGPGYFRGANRIWYVPGYRFDYLGLRLVRTAS